MPLKTLAVILAGGRGRRLEPLSADRAKPAVPFGGKYRIIDFTLSNCLHSGLRKVLVLTQYKSHSLQKHLRDGWSVFNPELGEYITTVPPQMRQGQDWYAGTADAIAQNVWLLERSGVQDVLILSGDHIYRMDYAALLAFHRQHGGELTIASQPVTIDEARSFGVLSVDADSRITGFDEKPAEPRALPDDAGRALASLGIYVFSLPTLLTALSDDRACEASSHDFGHDILPHLIEAGRADAYRFGEMGGRVSQDRYWRDVGTIDAYYDANMALLEPQPPLDLYQDNWPIRTYQQQHPPARTVPGASGNDGVFINSIAAGGVLIIGAGVHRSILFPRVRVEDSAIVERSILFEGVCVGEDAQLNNCIVDKHVSIPAGERIGMDPEHDRQRFTVSENGIVVVPRGYRFS